MCRNGILKIPQGYWCEKCVEHDFPRLYVVNQMRRSDSGENFHECRPTAACNANSTSFTVECAEGYLGPLCSQCADGYSKRTDDVCGICRSTLENVVLVSVSAFATILVIGGIAYQTTKDTSEDSEELADEGGKDEQILPDNLSLYNIKSFQHAILLNIDYLQIGHILASMKISPFRGISEWIQNVTTMSTMNPAKAGPFRCLTGLAQFHVALITMSLPLLVTVIGFALMRIMHAFTSSTIPLTRKARGSSG